MSPEMVGGALAPFLLAALGFAGRSLWRAIRAPWEIKKSEAMLARHVQRTYGTRGSLSR